MDLPLIPSFFKKFDIYQRLVDAENESIDKNIWDSEKATLRWAIGPGHQLVGSPIDEGNIKDLLEVEFNRRAQLGDSTAQHHINHILVFRRPVMEALVMRGFADEVSEGNGYRVRINRDGFLAGNILNQTDSLRHSFPYRIWVWLWWVVLALGIVILFVQAAPSLTAIGHKVQTSWTYLVRHEHIKVQLLP